MSPRFALWAGSILFVGLAFLGLGFCGYQKLQDLGDLASIETLILEDFPDVTHVTTTTLAEWQERPEAALLIIDCRKPSEFAISRIPEALNLTSARDVADHLEGREESPDHIIAYCSVGYRSARLARALEKRGIANVANLQGSIFRWASEDRPLETPQGEATDLVHPYHSYWSSLLPPGKAWSRESESP